jgi:hypothetical protein
VLKEYENELLSGPYQLALKHAALYLYLPFSTQVHNIYIHKYIYT